MNKKLKCVIIDDNSDNLVYLQSICRSIPDISVEKCYSDPDDFLFEYESSLINFDFCFLDIDMPKINGIEVAHRLKNKYIIFVTAHSEFAPEAFDLDAVDFIRKPISKSRVKMGIDKIIRRYENIINKSISDNTYQLFNTDIGKVNIKLDQILYFGPLADDEKERRDKRLLIEDGTELKLKDITAEEMLKHLPKDLFSQINRSEIISHSIISHIPSYDEIIPRKELIKKIPHLSIGGKYRKEFFSKLQIKK